MVAGHLQVKNGTYYCVLNYVDGNGKRQQKWISTKLPEKGNKKRATDILNEKRRTFVVGISGEGSFDLSSEMYFTDFLKVWLEAIRSTVGLTTLGGYQRMVNKVIIPYFEPKNLALCTVKAKDIQSFYIERLKTVSGTTVHKEHAILHKAFKYAFRMDLIPNNPCDKVDAPRNSQFTSEPYNEAELNELLEKTADHKLGLLILVAAFYGLRKSEALGIRWKSIDFEKNMLHINHTVTQAYVDGKQQILHSDRMKTKSSFRSFPLTPAIRERLLIWQVQQKRNEKICGSFYNKKDKDYVFTDEFGNLIKPDYVVQTFPKLLDQLGLRRIRFHDLRHTCATIMHDQKVPLKDVQMYLGHSDIGTTGNIYTNLDWDDKEESTAVMDHVIDIPIPKKAKSSWEK